MVQISSYASILALLSSLAAALPMPGGAEANAGGMPAVVEPQIPQPVHVTTIVQQHVPSPSPAAAEHVTTTVIAQHTPHPVAHTTTIIAAHETPSPAAHVTTTVVQQHTPPSPAAHPAPTYGSGSAKWDVNPQFNDCVQQCIATYGQGPGQYNKPSATQPTAAGSTGTGATHTVIVAPTQGVLRYIPFAVNATIGDTVKFMWGANNHTVTKSSSLLPCNRTGDAVFASGTQNKDFVFTQVVNTTEPTYFFCATPSHCQKGMFGIINPTTKFASASSIGVQMRSLAAENPTIAGYADMTSKATANNTVAARWGSNIDMEALPTWAHELVAENVLYTRNFLAANPETITDDGRVDLGTAQDVPLAIPQDIAFALNSAGYNSDASSDASAKAPVTAASTSSADVPPLATAEGLTAGGASATLASPKVLVAAMAVVATLML